MTTSNDLLVMQMSLQWVDRMGKTIENVDVMGYQDAVADTNTCCRPNVTLLPNIAIFTNRYLPTMSKGEQFPFDVRIRTDSNCAPLLPDIVNCRCRIL